MMSSLFGIDIDGIKKESEKRINEIEAKLDKLIEINESEVKALEKLIEIFGRKDTV